ncbi:MAG: VWA domain-containing protein [Methylovulum sp.]|nr:VWA domain-containing protein [Methylovulum sp.]TSA41619.1 MAG: VWA domain-containing protein [Methylococcaceae bacterium]
MIDFAWPWLLVSLPLPIVVRWWLPVYERQQAAALKVPFLDDLYTAESSRQRVQLTQRWTVWIAVLAWLLLVVAASRPQWLGEPLAQAISGRDVMLAVDLSGSMEAQDFAINKQPVDRLTAAKWVAGQFIERRTGDRIGLILFGTRAYLQTPLTFDRKTVVTLLNESALGLAGENTAIGDAIGLAVKRLGDQHVNSRVLILMTDGANTAGEITPLKAAELAATIKLKIYTIGIGADEMVVRSFFGNRTVNPSADLDEHTLINIAETTGGHYYRARNAQELENIYLRLDELEPIEKDKQYFRPRDELFFWPLSVALVLLAALATQRVN